VTHSHRAALLLALLGAGGSAFGAPGTIGLGETEVTVTENYGSGYVTVYRTGGSSGTVTVDFTVSGGDATPGSDYFTYSGTLKWYSGERFGQSISVNAQNDGTVEATETFNVTLSNPTGGATLGTNPAVVSIRDNDGPGVGTIRFLRDPMYISEYQLSQIQLERVDGKGGAVSATIVSTPGTAHEPQDYAPVNQVVSWADGEAGLKDFYMSGVDDGTGNEPDETLTLSFSGATGGVATEGPGTVIVDDIQDEGGGGGALSLGMLGFAAVAIAGRRRRR
jgi:hypothetical protein